MASSSIWRRWRGRSSAPVTSGTWVWPSVITTMTALQMWCFLVSMTGRLAHNNIGRSKPWIGIELQRTQSSRDAVGAKLTLRTGDRKLVRWMTGGSSYLSSHDKRVVFGLGNDTQSESRLEI